MANEYVERTLESLIEDAKKRGLVVVAPLPNEAFIDIDNVYELDGFHERLEFFKVLFPDVKATWTQSKRSNLHINVSFPEGVVLSPMERLMIQAVLNSDYKREMLGLKRLREGKDPDLSSILFELPNETLKDNVPHKMPRISKNRNDLLNWPNELMELFGARLVPPPAPPRIQPLPPNAAHAGEWIVIDDNHLDQPIQG